MSISRAVLAATLMLSSGLIAHAQNAPANPLSPVSGWSTQRAGVLPGAQAPILARESFYLSMLSNGALAGKTETCLRYGVTDQLSVGLTYLRKQETMRAGFNYTVRDESMEIPSINIGMYHDSITGGRNAYYATAGRTLSENSSTPFSAYVGVAKVTSESAPRLLFGAALPLFQGKWTASAQWEGKKLNLGLVADVGRIGNYPIHLGIIAIGNDTGPLAATTWRR